MAKIRRINIRSSLIPWTILFIIEVCVIASIAGLCIRIFGGDPPLHYDNAYF
jgi:hypothetical protein